MRKQKLNLLLTDLFLFVLLIVIEQVTKYMAVVHLKNQAAIPLIDGALELRYLENRGAAFGMLQNQKVFLIFVAVIILIIFTYILVKTPAQKKYIWGHTALVLIAAGGAGNMIDRIRLDYVVDFIYFSLINFPIFNVADIFVTVGTILLVILLLFIYKEEDLYFLSFKTKTYREIKENPEITDAQTSVENK